MTQDVYALIADDYREMVKYILIQHAKCGVETPPWREDSGE